MAFPGPGAQVYYNEAGEPLGWDYPSYEPPEIDDYEMDRRAAESEAFAENMEDFAETHGLDEDTAAAFGEWYWKRKSRFISTAFAYDTWREMCAEPS